jgi:dTDP-4-dehydrorhamnose reductase
MRKWGLDKSHLIHISTDSVYGNNGNKLEMMPWKETDQLNPLSVYAQSKLDGERELEINQGPYIILRTAFYGINSYSTKSLLWWIIDNARNSRTMEGWENIFFSPISAWSLVRISACPGYVGK